VNGIDDINAVCLETSCRTPGVAGMTAKPKVARPTTTHLRSEEVFVGEAASEILDRRAKAFGGRLKAIGQQPPGLRQIPPSEGIHKGAHSRWLLSRSTGSVNRGGRQSGSRFDDHEMQAAEPGNTLDDLSPTATDRRSADEKEGNVASQFRGQPHQLVD
jgi:hypothetical protein